MFNCVQLIFSLAKTPRWSGAIDNKKAAKVAFGGFFVLDIGLNRRKTTI